MSTEIHTEPMPPTPPMPRADERLVRIARVLDDAQRLAHVGSFEWDIPRNVVTWSDEMHRIYGVEPGTFDGTFEKFLARVHPDDAEHTRSVVLDAVRSVRPFVYDHRVVRDDGAVRMLHTRGDIIADEAGKPVRMLGSCWDVTDLTEARRHLERSLSLLEATVNATADGILVVNSEGCVTLFNQRLLDLWHFGEDDVKDARFADIVARADAQLENAAECGRTIWRVGEDPALETFDALRFRDGRFFERYSRPQLLGDEVVGRVWSYRDVTEREQNLEAATLLSDAARLLVSLDVEQALIGLAHRLVPAFASMCAIDVGPPASDRRLITVVSPDRSEADLPDLARVDGSRPALLRVNDVGVIVVPLVVEGRADGSIMLVAPTTRPFAKRDLALAEGIATRASLALENVRLYENVKAALRARDDFLSIAAHEIRGPLMSIHLAAQSLTSGLLSEGRKAEATRIIEREDRRLVAFVEELLELTRVRSGKLPLMIEPVDLVDLARRVVARFETDCVPASVVASGPVVGAWDRHRLEQIVANLVSNATKFGAGKPIIVAVQERDGRARLTVQDHGVGISAEDQSRVFEAFERAVSSRHYGGFGLGLYIVKRLVEALGGTVGLDSELGLGSTFIVELPMKRSAP